MISRPAREKANASLPEFTSTAPHFLAGIHLDQATPPKSPRPTASPPSSLAPRPDPVQPPAFLRWNFSNPVPPLTGAAADDLTVDDLLPLPPQPNLVRESLPYFPLVLVRALLAHVHRPFIGNAGDPTQPPPLLIARRVPPPPVGHIPSQTVP
jgi:hypothetical protein